VLAVADKGTAGVARVADVESELFEAAAASGS